MPKCTYTTFITILSLVIQKAIELNLKSDVINTATQNHDISFIYLGMTVFNRIKSFINVFFNFVLICIKIEIIPQNSATIKYQI